MPVSQRDLTPCRGLRRKREARAAYLGISKVAFFLPHQISHSPAVAHFSLVMSW